MIPSMEPPVPGQETACPSFPPAVQSGDRSSEEAGDLSPHQPDASSDEARRGSAAPRTAGAPGPETMFRLDGKRALVTGSSSGIGAAQAQALAAAGARVVVHGTRQDKIDAVVGAIRSAGGQASGVAGALSGGAGECQRLVDASLAQLGGLDILIHAAGTNRRKPLAQVTEDDFDAIIGVHLKAAFFVCQSARAPMEDAGGGKIVTIGSLTSFRGLGLLGPYGASKAAVAQLTQTMAVEWARYNIQVNCLAPGFITTPLTEIGLFGDPHRRAWILDRVPAGRVGTPDDLVGATLFLCSEASAYVTGQTLAVDGGFLTGGSFERPGEFEAAQKSPQSP